MQGNSSSLGCFTCCTGCLLPVNQQCAVTTDQPPADSNTALCDFAAALAASLPVYSPSAPCSPVAQPYSVSRMQRLVAVALATCNTLYMTVTFCSIMVFGDALHSDVLTNVNSAAMAPLIGPTAAALMAAIVRVGYLLSLIGSYVLLVYPLRQVGRVCRERAGHWVGWGQACAPSSRVDGVLLFVRTPPPLSATCVGQLSQLHRTELYDWDSRATPWLSCVRH